MPQTESSPQKSRLTRWVERDIKQPLEQLVGGHARLKVIVLLACLLALDAADKATVGAVAMQLKESLQLSNVDIGWLVAASTGVGALVTLPFGALVDQVHRIRLLVASIVLWSVAVALSGAANSFLMLLLTRLAMGGVAGVTIPATASLIGDYFRTHERGRIFGYVLTGELLGVAFGFLISGNVAAALSWRFAFWILAALGLLLAFVLWGHLPEPARGGQSCIPDGAASVPSSDDAAGTSDETQAGWDKANSAIPEDANSQSLQQKLEASEVQPIEEQVLRHDPADMSLWQAVRYILSVRSYRSLVVASALGYFYFTGVRTFAIIFMSERFGLSQGMATSLSVALGLGAVAGVLLAGSGSDALIRRGHLSGRVVGGAAAYLLATLAFPPALLAGTLWVAGPFLFLAAAGIGGANPGIDAARLDVMHSGLWGRAEGVQATVRFGLEAIAPPLFGWVSTGFDSDRGGVVRAAAGASSESSAGGLQFAFLVMLLPLAGAGLLLWFRTRRTYPSDALTAMASERSARGE